MDIEEVKTEAEAIPAKEKKKMSKGTKALLITACTLLGIAILMAGTVIIMDRLGENALTDDGAGVDMSDSADVLENGNVRYKGKLYRYNNRITTILLMGVDDREKTEFDGVYGANNQSDANLLVVLDPVNEKLTLISISRDSMCDIKVLDREGNFVGTDNTQLALAYSFGDGAERSCELTCDAVSGILHGISIPAYGSIYIDGICDLVELVGGVEITPTDNWGGYAAGQTVLLKGAAAENYIRYRSHTTEGNNDRMARQNQVILALVHKGLDMAKNDPFSIPELYRSVSENVTTNVDISKMVYLAKIAVNLDFDSEIHKIQGESVLGEGNHAEYVIDEAALYDMIIDIFYLPVEN